LKSRPAYRVEAYMHGDPNLSDTRYLTADVMRRLYAVPEEIIEPDEVSELRLDETGDSAS